MHNIIIRPACQEDATAMHRIRLQPKVRSGVSALPDERLDSMENYLKNANSNTRILVCELDGEVIGTVSLDLGVSRQRHVGFLGMMVDEQYHGQGIGSKLIEAMLDIADNYLNLVRIQLDVMEDNHSAIALYKKYGFVEEGHHKYAFIKNGQYIGLITMARYNMRLVPSC